MKRPTSIKGKLFKTIQIINGAVLLSTCGIFFGYEYVSYKQARAREIKSLGRIVAASSTAALAFDDQHAATEALGTLHAEPRITAACLYNNQGDILAFYPQSINVKALPDSNEGDGYEFYPGFLQGFEPVVQGDRRVGTLFLRYNIDALYQILPLYAMLALIIIGTSSLLAYFLFRRLQHSISKPVLALAQTAVAIADRKDFSVRAVKQSDDEVGLFTDAFNEMLNKIEAQTKQLQLGSEQLIAILNADLSAVIVIDRQGCIQEWNQRAERIFGWEKQEVIGKSIAEVIIPEALRDAHRWGFQHYLDTGEQRILGKLLQLSAIRKSGEEFPVELSISVLDTNGVCSFCGFITDITDRKKAEEEIKAFNNQLEKMVTERTRELEMVNKELESFSYSISHDLRAPLRSIHGYINILHEEYGPQLDVEAIRLMDVIQKNGLRMGRLIDDLLTFSRLGRREISRSDVMMMEIVTVVVEELKRSDAGGRTQFDVQTLPWVQGDPATIRQVWENLLSNAVKYSQHKRSPKVEVGYFEQGQEIIFYVKDNGAGFNMDYYNKLFGVFQRLHAQHEFEGTGVGLAIVHRIISKHKGKIWADAKPDEGATFYFTLNTGESS